MQNATKTVENLASTVHARGTAKVGQEKDGP